MVIDVGIGLGVLAGVGVVMVAHEVRNRTTSRNNLLVMDYIPFKWARAQPYASSDHILYSPDSISKLCDGRLQGGVCLEK